MWVQIPVEGTLPMRGRGGAVLLLWSALRAPKPFSFLFCLLLDMLSLSWSGGHTPVLGAWKGPVQAL